MVINKWKTLGRALLFCLLCAIAVAVASRLTHNLQGQWSILLTGLIACCLTAAFTLIFVKWEGVSLADVGVVPGKKTAWHILAGFFMGLVLAIIQPLLVLLMGHAKLTYTAAANPAIIALALLVYFVLASREELAFRGYPLQSLNRALGPWPAQIIVAVIFALEHVVGGVPWLQAFLGAGVGSILFGIAALKTKGLALPIGLHAAWNFGQWALGFKDNSGLWKVIVEPGYQHHFEQMQTIAYLIVMVPAIALFYFWQRNRGHISVHN
ncbi:MAG: CPBP family intramembrane glutamic endopeptidase [Sphingobacteriales bacterium]